MIWGPSYLKEISVDESSYIPWDEVELSDTKERAQDYWDGLREGKYLHAPREDEGGQSLILFGPDADTVAVSLLVAITTSEDTLVRYRDSRKTPWQRYSKPFTDVLAADRAVVRTADGIAQLSKDAFDDPDARDAYRSMFPSYPLGFPKPLIVGVRNLADMQATDWNTRALTNLFDERRFQGKVTIVSSTMGLTDLSRRFGARMLDELDKSFISVPPQWQ